MTRARTVPVRVPEEVARRLQEEADARGVYRDWLAGRLLVESLDRLVPAEQFSLTRRRAEPAPAKIKVDESLMDDVP